MKTVILDLNGVILEKADVLVIKNAIIGLGPVAALTVLAAYKTGKITPEQLYLIERFIAKTEAGIKFLPGAKDAIKALAGRKDTKIKICSNFSSQTGYDDRLREYINKNCDDLFANPDDITLLPINKQKKEFYERERNMAAPDDQVIVVDDSIHNIKAAAESGCYAVMITNNNWLSAKAKKLYGAAVHSRFCHFVQNTR
jgi:beta-phosphoglucomutase-like phosphatase (HAD superfamily)